MVARAFVAAIGSFIFPGLGHAVAGRNRWAIAWAVAVPVAMLLVFVSMWFFLISFALRLLSALLAFWATRAVVEKVERFAPLVFVVGGLSALTFVAMRLVVIEGFKTPSSSMYPTLQIGDHIFIDKLSRHWRPYHRGEVVVFVYPCDTERDYIKRIMAVGGDTIEVRCNVVYVTGKAVPDTLMRRDVHVRRSRRQSAAWVRAEVHPLSRDARRSRLRRVPRSRPAGARPGRRTQR